MFKPPHALIFAALLAALGASSARAADVKALLKDADAYRLPDQSMRVETEVKVYKADALDKTRLYTVYTKPGRRSLVVFRSSAERGQKMLMLGDDFWLVMPTSQRPLRITPMQKLLGDAATGDIATMTWSEDYDGVVAGERVVDGVPCLRLDLHATAKGTTYARIVLDIAQDDHRPLQADLYVASGKLAKRATFTLGEIDGRVQVTAMRLIDSIQTGRETVVRYLRSTPQTIPDEYYNPMFLVRSDLGR